MQKIFVFAKHFLHILGIYYCGVTYFNIYFKQVANIKDVLQLIK